MAELSPEDVTEELTETDEEEQKKKKTEEVDVPSCTFCLLATEKLRKARFDLHVGPKIGSARQRDGPQLRRPSMKS